MMTSSTEPGPIGDPPKAWKAEQKKAWRDFAAELPHLNVSHTALLEVACEYRAHLRHGAGHVTAAIYLETLRLLGATPVISAASLIINPET